MTPEQVKAVVGNHPHMTLEQGRWICHHLRTYKLARILELGTLYGVSACYLGSVAAQFGGSVLTLDLPTKRDPEPETHIEQCGLSGVVRVQREVAGAEWVLMKLIEQGVEPYDFCYIDANHTWKGAGFQFLLVDRLLRPGGWVLFDDIHWAYAKSHSETMRVYGDRLTPEERTTEQVGKVWELLVKRHPGYINFIERDQWGLCQKRP